MHDLLRRARAVRDRRVFSTRLVVLTVSLATAGAPAVAAQGLERVSVHGFLSQGYMHSQTYDYLAQSAEGTFHYSEMGLTISSQASSDLRIGAQLFARELGELGRNRIDLDWAYGDYAWRNWAGLRAGKIKMPYGLYNETRDVDALRTSVLLPQGVYDLRFRDFLVSLTGASIYGTSPPSGIGSLEYQFFWGTSAQRSDGSVAQLMNSLGPFTIDALEVRHTGGAALIWNAPRSGLRFGASLNHFDWGMNLILSPEVLPYLAPLGASPVETMRSKNTRALTFSGEGQWDRLTLAAERSRWQGTAPHPFLPFELGFSAWYGQASYRLTDRLEIGSYFSEIQDDEEGSAADAEATELTFQRDLATSVRFDVNDFWILKAEVHFIRGTAAIRSTDHPASEDDAWSLFAAKTSFVF